MEIEIWSDVVCPWCWIGRRHLELALEQFAHRGEVTLHWRSFELDPGAPASRDGAYADRLAAKYGTSVAQAQQMIDRMAAAGAAVGLDYRFDLARPGNTFDAHRLLHLAGVRGLQDQLKDRLFRATFTEGEPISDPATLTRLAVEVGLDERQVADVLASDSYAAEVRADEKRAGELGATGVPFFVIDARYGVPGAQPPESLLQVIDKAWADAHPAPVLVAAGDIEAPGCADGTCAV